MKAIKLKPLFFPANDVFVSPPEILSRSMDYQVEKFSDHAQSDIGELVSILKLRRVKRQDAQKKQIPDDEKETVRKLSEWKNMSPKRKFTFRKMITINQAGRESNSIQRYIPEIEKPEENCDILNSLVLKVQNIVTIEKNKRRNQDEEMKIISEKNLRFEEEVKKSIQRLSTDIKSLKHFIRESTNKLEALKKQFNERTKKYEEESAAISLSEAQELLFKEKTKKVIKPCEEAQYLVRKDKFRKLKQDLHKKYQEDKEKINAIIESISNILDSSIHQRQVSKKELKQHHDNLVLLYCKTLKDGKDLRSEGLR